MEINVSIKLDMDEAAELLVSSDDFAQDIISWVSDLKKLGQNMKGLAQAPVGFETPEPKSPAAEEAPPIDSTPQQQQAPVIKLEEVRAKLAALSQAGKQEQVKALIQEFGASKLTEIPEDKYPELLEEAGKL